MQNHMYVTYVLPQSIENNSYKNICRIDCVMENSINLIFVSEMIEKEA